MMAKNLSKNGNVVVVSINHRLNILGYLNLSDFGKEYSNSGNAGMADIVAALKWVHENILNFGGDPDNVTIFGQSGGGGKVTTLMQIPEAAGLFSKAIVQSGVLDIGPATTHEESSALAHAVIENLGIAPQEISKLQTISYHDLANVIQKGCS